MRKRIPRAQTAESAQQQAPPVCRAPTRHNEGVVWASPIMPPRGVARSAGAGAQHSTRPPIPARLPVCLSPKPGAGHTVSHVATEAAVQIAAAGGQESGESKPRSASGRPRRDRPQPRDNSLDGTNRPLDDRNTTVFAHRPEPRRDSMIPAPGLELWAGDGCTAHMRRGIDVGEPSRSQETPRTSSPCNRIFRRPRPDGIIGKDRWLLNKRIAQFTETRSG